MKNRIIKILLILFIIVHVASPLFEAAFYGYDDLAAILTDVYNNAVIVVLSAAVLRLYNSKGSDE